MKRSSAILFVVAMGSLLQPVVAGAAPAAGSVKYKENLALVPGTDPDPTAAPQVLEGMRGVHPRLLFTQQEIDRLRKNLETDPILQRVYKDHAERAKRFKLSKERPPSIVMEDTPALAQSIGYYPVLAYLYALDRDPNVKQAIVDILTMMIEEPHWSHAAELDCNMGAANNMLMVAVLFDAVCNELDPAFRLKVAEKLLLTARRMYYLGYEKRALDVVKYWQQDPQANHRWHRGAGMVAALLAIADLPEVKSGFLLERMKKEMDFLTTWYPSEGDSHEGAGYQVFGFFYLAIACETMDRILGTEYLQHPGFRNAWAQHLYYTAPGRMSHMSFGDDQNKESSFGNLESAFFLSPRLSRDRDVQAALARRFKSHARRKDAQAYAYPWLLMKYYDPTVGEGDHRALPTHKLFDDLGAASMRDSWEGDAVHFTFKCGPYGGYRLNDYRHENPDENGQPHYVNVAHDDPDANGFAIGKADEFLVHPGVYSTLKMTQENNTLLVNGRGQIGEGDAYTQPVPGVDMRTLSYLTGWIAGDGGRIIIEGEAGAAYPDHALQRYRRTAVWMPGEYILLLDDVRAKGEQQIAWNANAGSAQFDDPGSGRCHVDTKGGKRMDFQMLANKEFQGSFDHFRLTGRWGNEMVHQIRFFLTGEAVKFACLMDPWGRKLDMALKEEGDEVALTIRSADFEDAWTWRGATDADTPSSLTGRRGGKALIALTESDKAPRGDAHAAK